MAHFFLLNKFHGPHHFILKYSSHFVMNARFSSKWYFNLFLSKQLLYYLIFIGGKLCSFSPCIEQVQRTCEKLTSVGFVELKTFENLQTELQVHYKSIPILDFESLKEPEVRYGLYYCLFNFYFKKYLSSISKL